MHKDIAIIEIGSNNTKVHFYENKKLKFDSTTTIEFKKNYQLNKRILQQDLEKLYQIIEETIKKTKKLKIFIFLDVVFLEKFHKKNLRRLISIY